VNSSDLRLLPLAGGEVIEAVEFKRLKESRRATNPESIAHNFADGFEC